MIFDLVSRLGSDRAGQSLVVFTLAAPAALGGAGLAVDYSNWSRQQAALQAVADTAALAATYELTRTGDPTLLKAKAEQAALSFAAANGGDREVAVAVDPTLLSAEVSVSEPAFISFGRMFGVDPFDIEATTVARLAEKPEDACIVALDETAKTGISFSGSAVFRANSCLLWSNAQSSQSVVVGGSAVVDVDRLCAAGGIALNGGSSDLLVDGARPSGFFGMEDCGSIGDPLASRELPDPEEIPCTETKLRIVTKDPVTLPPGRYCGGVSISSDADVTLEAGGLYIIDGGPMKLTAGGDITGERVSVFMTGKQATFDASGQGKVRLTAPTEGLMKGIVLSSDRAQTGNLSTRISGGASLNLVGTVYLKNQDFVWRGNSDGVDPSKVTQIVAKTVDVAGNTEINYETAFAQEGFDPIEVMPVSPYIAK